MLDLPGVTLRETGSCGKHVERGSSLGREKHLSDVQNRIVPDQWKEANDTLGYKAGDMQVVCNYRPILLLRIISKVMERCLHNHIYP